jgi:hypothetical protein
MSKSKKVMEFADAVNEWEKVAKTPYEEGDINDEGEMDSAIIADESSPMVHYFMDEPTKRVVLMQAKIGDDNGDAAFVFYPLNAPLFTVGPAAISESGGSIMIDTLDRKKDSVIRPLEKEDAVWAIGRVVDTMRELLDQLRRMDN